MFGVPVEKEQIIHHFSTATHSVTPIEMARILKLLGCKATLKKNSINGLKPQLFPLIAQCENSEYVILAKYDVDEQRILVQKA